MRSSLYTGALSTINQCYVISNLYSSHSLTLPMNCPVLGLFTTRSTHTVTVFNYKGWPGSWPCLVRSCKSRSIIFLLLKYDFPRLMDNHLLPLGNCFSSPTEVIGFAPIETINLIRNGGFFLYWLEFFHPILFIGTGHWYWKNFYFLFCSGSWSERVAHTPEYMFLDAEDIPEERGILLHFLLAVLCF